MSLEHRTSSFFFNREVVLHPFLFPLSGCLWHFLQNILVKLSVCEETANPFILFFCFSSLSVFCLLCCYHGSVQPCYCLWGAPRPGGLETNYTKEPNTRRLEEAARTKRYVHPSSKGYDRSSQCHQVIPSSARCQTSRRSSAGSNSQHGEKNSVQFINAISPAQTTSGSPATKSPKTSYPRKPPFTRTVPTSQPYSKTIVPVVNTFP